jgi:hypothetical protein
VIRTEGGRSIISARGKITAVQGTAPARFAVSKWESIEKTQAYLNSPERKALGPENDKAIKVVRQFIISCKAPFADSAQVGLFLFSTAAVLPTSASVSAFCCKCPREKSPADIDHAATRVLRRLMPNGSFEDTP